MRGYELLFRWFDAAKAKVAARTYGQCISTPKSDAESARKRQLPGASNENGNQKANKITIVAPARDCLSCTCNAPVLRPYTSTWAKSLRAGRSFRRGGRGCSERRKIASIVRSCKAAAILEHKIQARLADILCKKRENAGVLHNVGPALVLTSQFEFSCGFSASPYILCGRATMWKRPLASLRPLHFAFRWAESFYPVTTKRKLLLLCLGLTWSVVRFSLRLVLSSTHSR